jgi:Kef-type K+ transport system membrane component KefB
MVSAGPLSRTLQEVRAGGATERARVFVEALAMEVSAVLAFSMLSVRSGGILESALVLASVVLGILASGRFGLGRILSAAEGHLRTMEVVFSILVGFVLLLGFLAQAVGFNSAMAAFFLGVFASDYLRRNVYLLEKMRAITYGFFEPMFFFGLGLYFVRVDYGIAILGLGLFALAMSIKFVLGSQMARLIRVGGLRNFFAIAHEGGVDGAIMLTALQLGLVGGAAYSSAMLAILLMAIIAPLGYGGRSALARHRPTPSLEFVRYELEDVTAEELSRTLPTVYARGRQRPRRPVVGAGAGREGHGAGGRFDEGQGIRQRARPFPRRGLRLDGLVGIGGHVSLGIAGPSGAHGGPRRERLEGPRDIQVLRRPGGRGRRRGRPAGRHDTREGAPQVPFPGEVLLADISLMSAGITSRQSATIP